jgi:hypothetical protein
MPARPGPGLTAWTALVVTADPALLAELPPLLDALGWAVTPGPDPPVRAVRNAHLALVDAGPGLPWLARVRPVRPNLPVLVVADPGDMAALVAVAAYPPARLLASPVRAPGLARAMSALLAGR